MKLSDNNKRTLISIFATIGILSAWGGATIGGQYIYDHYVKYNIEQMINISHQIPDPAKKENENIHIFSKGIDKMVIVYRVYPNLSMHDGVQFYSDYAKNNGWKIESNRMESDNSGESVFHLVLQKNGITCNISHAEYSNAWRFRFQKDTVYKNL